MRLYNIYYLCKKCEKDMAGLVISNIRTGTYRIDGWERYKETLFVLRRIDFLKDEVDSFYETIPVFVREKEQPEIDEDIKKRLISKKNSILQKMRTVVDLYESMEIGAGDGGIDVKIPQCDSLHKYISYLRDIDFVFSQCPFLQHKDGRIEFKTVDVGSQWLTFLVTAACGTAAASYIMGNVALLVDKAIQLKSHLSNLKQQEEIIRSQKLQNDVLQSNLEIFETLKRHYLSEAVKEIEDQNETTPIMDGEDRGKIEKSLEKLCGLLDKGVEIYASINTDKEIQVLFPAMKGSVELPDNIIKYLEEKNTKDE